MPTSTSHRTTADLLSTPELVAALTLRDLTDPAQGPHAAQLLLDAVTSTLSRLWGCPVRSVRPGPLVAVADNYDRLGYRTDDVTRARRYTRYASPTTMLRSHTSAAMPHELDRYRAVAAERARARLDGRRAPAVDELLVAPGLVHRRDVVDRTHVGAPYQVDLWRIRTLRTDRASDREALLAMAGAVVQAVLPGASWRAVPTTHPYTTDGLQVDVEVGGEWLELAECGLVAPAVLRGSGLDPIGWSGLALGLGLDRAVMLRKGVDDIRWLRSAHPRAASQMLDLEPWRPVSTLPAARRDLSVVLDRDAVDPPAGGPLLDEEVLGDRVRTALGERASDLERVQVVAVTAHEDLPPRVQERLGTVPGQVNALLRLVLRPLERTLTSWEADLARDAVYRALHCGPHAELARPCAGGELGGSAPSL
ncbi:PheS-related mystery ligase SrmL [Quadrisphaera oryzae]|uniref:PheS-related mystery ligase SrmL n=1 Tax=Quadrisphaera TaxID=317661 RepID=UPI001C979804